MRSVNEITQLFDHPDPGHRDRLTLEERILAMRMKIEARCERSATRCAVSIHSPHSSCDSHT